MRPSFSGSVAAVRLAFAFVVFLATEVRGDSTPQIGIGMPCPILHGRDAFGKDATSPAPPVILLLCFEKNSGSDLNRELAQHGESFLKENKVCVAADMHAMPRFVRAFVYPSLRELPHKLLLVESEDGMAPFPRRPGLVTVIHVGVSGNAEAIDFVAPAAVIAKVGATKP